MFVLPIFSVCYKNSVRKFYPLQISVLTENLSNTVDVTGKGRVTKFLYVGGSGGIGRTPEVISIGERRCS